MKKETFIMKQLYNQASEHNCKYTKKAFIMNRLNKRGTTQYYTEKETSKKSLTVFHQLKDTSI